MGRHRCRDRKPDGGHTAWSPLPRWWEKGRKVPARRRPAVTAASE